MRGHFVLATLVVALLCGLVATSSATQCVNQYHGAAAANDAKIMSMKHLVRSHIDFKSTGQCAKRIPF